MSSLGIHGRLGFGLLMLFSLDQRQNPVDILRHAASRRTFWSQDQEERVLQWSVIIWAPDTPQYSVSLVMRSGAADAFSDFGERPRWGQLQTDRFRCSK